VNDSWYQVAKLIFNVSFSQVPICYRWTQRSRSNVEYTQLKFGSPLCHPYFDPSPSLFGFRPILWEPHGL